MPRREAAAGWLENGKLVDSATSGSLGRKKQSHSDDRDTTVFVG